MRRHGGAGEHRRVEWQQRRLNPIRRIDLRFHALALDDPLHMRREIFVRVDDFAPRHQRRDAERAGDEHRRQQRDQRLLMQITARDRDQWSKREE